jgi:hypothetical protein
VHVAYMKVVVGKPEGERPRVTPRRASENNINMERERMSWTGLTRLTMKEVAVLCERRAKPALSTEGREILAPVKNSKLCPDGRTDGHYQTNSVWD